MVIISSSPIVRVICALTIADERSAGTLFACKSSTLVAHFYFTKNIRDNDSKFGPCFARVAVTSGIKLPKTPYHAKRPNAICERFLLSVRRECLDHILILHEKQLHRVLRCYVAYFNRARPHQGIQQQIPELLASSSPQQNQREKVIAIPLLGGLHHDYRKVA